MEETCKKGPKGTYRSTYALSSKDVYWVVCVRAYAKDKEDAWSGGREEKSKGVDEG